MKNRFLALGVFLLTFAAVIFIMADITPQNHVGKPHDNGGGGGGTVTYYERSADECSHAQGRSWVRCHRGGNELCIPQNCP